MSSILQVLSLLQPCKALQHVLSPEGARNFSSWIESSCMLWDQSYYESLLGFLSEPPSLTPRILTLVFKKLWAEPSE